MPLNPLAQSTNRPSMPRGDEVQSPLMSNPFPQGSQEAADYENGYQYCQDWGHMQLAAATPDQLQKWKLNSTAWKQGFADAARSMGLSIVGDQLLAPAPKMAARTYAEKLERMRARKDPDHEKTTEENLKTWAELTELHSDPEHQHHLRFECAKCGNAMTCRCSAPKKTYVGLCDKCAPQKTADLTALPHQENVATKLEDSPGQVAVHGLGSGKTFTAIHSARKLKLPILAVVPAALRNNFKKELHSANFEHPAKVVSYQQAMNMADDPKFRDYASKSLLVFDEAHRMGQVTSARSDLTHTLPSKKKLLLTGTPIRNSPEEIAPLVNAVSPGTFPDDPEEFKKKYIGTREVPVGFWGRLKGHQPGQENIPINLHHFANAVKGKVDFYNSVDRSEFPSHDEKIIDVPMSHKQEAAYNYVMGKYPTFSYRVKHGLPLNRRADQDFQAFMIGPRQVANHPAGFNSSATDHDAPKIHAMANEIEHRFKKDKNFRGVSYSSFLDSGINPLSRELQRRKIPHQIFTGDINDKERAEIVKSYNTGKNPLLLVSGAGAEGLDLKGTKLMQIMEPHWQEELIGQVKGRGIRYKSHSHLPENERHVEVQRFHSVPRVSAWDKLLGRKRSGDQGVDEYIYDMAKKKSQLNNAFMNAMKPEPMQKAAEFTMWQPVDDKFFPGLLVDLDDTLITQAGGFSKELGRQTVLPNRIQILQQFKDKGYKIIGITNRALIPGEPWGPDDLMSLNKETLDLFPGLLDDIVCCMFMCEHQKPAPTMIFKAMTEYSLDPSNIVFVGDHEKDLWAAEAAGVPFYWAHEFFMDPERFKDLPMAAPAMKQADWTDHQNMVTHVVKHGPEFGGHQQYLDLEQELSKNPLPDAVRINRRCTTTYLPGGKEVTRCATGYHSPSTGLLHVKDDQTGKTVTLYRKGLLRGASTRLS